MRNVTLATGMTESWGRTHEDASEAIGLDTIGEPGELGISKDLGPARQVEAGLRGEVRKLDSDRHGTKIVVLSLGSKRGRARDAFFLALKRTSGCSKSRAYRGCHVNGVRGHHKRLMCDHRTKSSGSAAQLLMQRRVTALHRT